MTTTIYDPDHPDYLDEANLRTELSRVFAVCDDCRMCLTYCDVFPSLVALLDGVEERDPGLLTPAEQDRLVESCTQCGLCAVSCPFTPNRHASAIDFPALMMRADATRIAAGHVPWRRRLAHGRWGALLPSAWRTTSRH
jgi:ferredoxin